MPFLDVSDIVEDPLFADTFMVKRFTQTVDNDGYAQTTMETFPNVIGTVTQNSGVNLKRLADGQMTTNVITIHTKFRLTSSEEEFDADIVTWAGSDYTVVSVHDWSRFGNGFIMALCEQKRLNT